MKIINIVDEMWNMVNELQNIVEEMWNIANGLVGTVRSLHPLLYH